MTTALHLTNLSVAALVMTAAVWDVRTRRVPNWLVISGLAFALLTQCLEHGVLAGSWTWLLGTATGLGLFLGIYLLGGMGAGDVKLMGAVGAFMAPTGVLHVTLVSFIVGGALALTMMLIRGNAHRMFANVSALLLSLPFGGKTTAAGHDKKDKTTQLPYAVAIAIGTLLVMEGVL
ncbi:prepilin peptidase [Ralstonia insidiosa]|jgi:prepilin peptidase CpaA|uniref:A24 family peptidase n=1 Tax=Ralstonia TaxID=48736 RepID=UPI0006648EEF|nr:prepilin peptidase [Ralstonia insidiosa]KMW45256.1 precorrin-2 dehydrogenase [Ralstonia sp. MD27]MBX3774493.1 prepilin peptidase [Ralstonia pickettii]NOZ16403.1 precorrin-2 dehydrogenase [Betaproteobacteria bacterium]MBA9859017.1 precorrin-2 dehydrogenase [Ralstonia insidiosa]MBA9873501.1 precorrin-2 dehydrogenase [Ralstonia insidiosa]